MSDDLLEALLRAALAEGGTLDERNLPRFAAALRARAQQILHERVRPLEERAAAFEKESAWRAEVARNLEREQKEFARQQREFERERGELLVLERTTAEAHERLLAHHRRSLRHLAETLESLPAGLPWSYRRVRAQIAEIVAALRRDGA